MMEALQTLAVPACIFYFLCCAYLGWRDKDWWEVGIACLCLMLGFAAMILL